MSNDLSLDTLNDISDANFYGYCWKGNDLHLELHDASDRYHQLICKWSYDLVIQIEHRHGELKMGGPLLTADSSVVKTPLGYEVNLDFAHYGYFNFSCSEIELVQ